MEAMDTLTFYRGKRVFVTGHTGFKGMWLSKILAMAGADVLGYSLESPTEEGRRLFDLAIRPLLDSRLGDVRDFDRLQKTFEEFRPEIVFHLAAQPIVLESYRDPVGTYAANVMGTVHLLECVRRSDRVRSVVNVTTDKVYENREWEWGYRENDALDGFDPYSNSKTCSELVTRTFCRSFFSHRKLAVSTVRAGNVIGGGDFSKHRILPDCIRAASKGDVIEIRNPMSIRPYQHVLEAILSYLLVAERQYDRPELAGSYNVGPDESDCVPTSALATLFCKAWGEGIQWKSVAGGPEHEASFLKLDCCKLKRAFGWKPVWRIDEAVRRTVEWGKAWVASGDVIPLTERQISDYISAGSQVSQDLNGIV